MKVISYYTNEKYERAAKLLETSLNRFGIANEIEHVTDQGTPLKNKHFKASYLLWKLQETKEDILVWMDADTVLRKNPLTFRYPTQDVMMYSPGGGYFWSTVVILRNTDAAKEILRAWIEGHKQKPLCSDANIPEDRRIGHLHARYVWYEPVFRPMYPEEDPIVEHYCLGRNT
jgi:hypothetical protein